MSAYDPNRNPLRAILIGLATRFGKSIGQDGTIAAYPRLFVRLWTRGGFHERDHLSDRTYRGGYGHSFIPRIALATQLGGDHGGGQYTDCARKS